MIYLFFVDFGENAILCSKSSISGALRGALIGHLEGTYRALTGPLNGRATWTAFGLRRLHTPQKVRWFQNIECESEFAVLVF